MSAAMIFSARAFFCPEVSFMPNKLPAGFKSGHPTKDMRRARGAAWIARQTSNHRGQMHGSSFPLMAHPRFATVIFGGRNLKVVIDKSGAFGETQSEALRRVQISSGSPSHFNPVFFRIFFAIFSTFRNKCCQPLRVIHYD